MSNLLIDFMLTIPELCSMKEEEPPEIFPGTKEALEKLTIGRDEDE